MKKKKEYAGQTIMRMIVSLILSLLIPISLALTIARFTVFNSDFLIQNMAPTSYTEKMCLIILDEYQIYGDASGVDRSFFEKLVDRSQFENDAQTFIRQSFIDTSYKIDKATMQTKYNEELLRYTREKNVEMTDQLYAEINALSEYCLTFYEKQVRNTFIKQIGILSPSIQKVMIIADIILLIALGILFCFRKGAFGSWRGFSAAFISATILTGICLVFLITWSPLEKLSVTPRPFYDLAVYDMTRAFYVFLMVFGVMLVTAVVMFILNIARGYQKDTHAVK